MATSTSYDSVSLESFAFSISSKSWQAWIVHPHVCSIWSWCNWDHGLPYFRGKLKEYMRDLRESLDEIHKKVGTSVNSSRTAKRKNVNKKRWAVKFDKGHYVLEPPSLSKLQLRWNCSYQITGVVSDLGFLSSIWSARLQVYCWILQTFSKTRWVRIYLRTTP
jgi:hypothetical protein